MSSVLAKRMPLRSADFQSKNVFGRRIRRKPALRGRTLFASTEVMHTPTSDSPLHFDIENIYQIRTGKSNASARHLFPATLLKRWPHVCCVKISFELLPNNWFVSTKSNSMKCFVNWIPANLHFRLNKTQPYLKGGPEPIEKEINEILSGTFNGAIRKLILQVSGRISVLMSIF